MKWLALLLAILWVPNAVAQVQSDDVPLMGQSATELEAILGRPSLVRPELPAQIWQYADELCVLQVYLYASSDAGDAAVNYVEARMRGDDQPPMNVDQVRPCLAARGVDLATPDGDG